MADNTFPPGQGAPQSDPEDAAQPAGSPASPENLRAHPATEAQAPAGAASELAAESAAAPTGEPAGGRAGEPSGEGVASASAAAPHSGEEHAAQVNPVLGNPAQVNPVQGNPAQVNPVQVNPVQGNPAQGNPAQGNPAQVNPALGNPAQGGLAQDHPTQEFATQEFAAQHNPAQGYPTQGYPTQVLPDAFGQPAAQGLPQGQPLGQPMGQPLGQPVGEPAPQAAASKRGHSTGTFLAGLAVAALIGGIVGGGVSSLVVANAQPKGGAISQQGGTVKLNNPETATEISGVAMVGTPSVVTLSVSSQTEAGSGSGVIYSEDGYIITNAHVVTLGGAASDPRIRVKHSDGRVFDGTLVGVAPYSDIAVVKIDAEGLTPIEVADSSEVNVGDLAVAIGAPMSLSNTVTSGVVSALNRGISVGSALIPQDPSQEGQEGQEDPQEQGTPDSGRGFPWDFRFDTPREGESSQQSGGQVTLPVVQTDASINPGNSGGALLNAKAELIGINVAIASPGATEGNASSAGLGFAIPADLATRVADEIIAGDKPTHGLLGASVVDSSLDTDADANHAGGLIKEIVRGGAAGKAGLKIGDVITAVDGVPAADGTSVSALIRMHAGDSEVTIDYTRGGVAGQVTATLGTLDW